MMAQLPTKDIERIEELAAENIEKAREAVNEKLDSAHQKISDAAGHLRESAADLDTKPSGTLYRVGRIVDEKKQLLEARARHVSDLAKNGYGQVSETVGELGAKARLFTRKNPIKSTAVAVGLGIATGLALRQARS